ncbi:MAG: YceI family protein [Bacteroidetes bacterium]|nr:YceI family protein [Bacteroidota bacterium]
MYYANFLLTLITCTMLTPVRPLKENTTWVVQSSSSISINGRTNISRFSCGVPQYTEPDTIKFLNEGCRGKTSGIPLCGILKINIADFDCRNRMMTGEFKKTLQYQKYPHLKIIFLNLEKMPDFGTKPEFLKGQVIIELAGVSKQLEIDYTAAKENDQSVTLTGMRQISFSDFNLDPPTKMGGLVRVNEIIDVQFLLCLRKLE